MLSWLVRIQLTDYTEFDEAKVAHALQQLHDKRPEWVSKMRELSRN